MFRGNPRATVGRLILTILIQKSEKLPTGDPSGNQTFLRGCAPQESLITVGTSLEQIFSDSPFVLSTVSSIPSKRQFLDKPYLSHNKCTQKVFSKKVLTYWIVCHRFTQETKLCMNVGRTVIPFVPLGCGPGRDNPLMQKYANISKFLQMCAKAQL